MRKALFTGCLLLLAIAVPLAAQPAEGKTFRVLRSELELQYFHFGNFYQATEGLPEDDVNAVGFEYRAAYRKSESSPDIYGALYATRFGADDTETTYGGRVGVSRYGSVHSFNVYLDHAENGYAFDVEDTRAIASITMLDANYSMRFTKDWQAGVDGYYERQSFNVQDTGFENDYHSLGLQLRYRGLGRILTPRVGYVRGNRDVRNDLSSYDDHYWYLQLDTQPNPRVSASLRYRDRTRDYTNVDRVEDRTQWRLRGEIRQNERLAWAASYTYEQVDSSRAGRDFDTNVFYAGLVIGF